MSYNMTWTDSAVNLVDLISGVNTTSGNLFGGLLLVVIFVVMFAGFRSVNRKDDFVISSFVTTIVAGLMWFIGFIPWSFAIIPLVLFVASMIIKFFSD